MRSLTGQPAPTTITTLQPQATTIPITVTAYPESKIYGNADPFLGYQITSGALVGSDAFTGSLSRVAGENVGSYTILEGSLGLPASYNLTFLSSVLIIVPRPITVTADAKSKNYGAPNPILTYVVGGLGLVSGDSLSGALATTAKTNSAVGSYPITQGALANPNYAIAYVGAKLTVRADRTPTPTPMLALHIAALISNAIKKANADAINAVKSDPEVIQALGALGAEALARAIANKYANIIGDAYSIVTLLGSTNLSMDAAAAMLSKGIDLASIPITVPGEFNTALLIGYAARTYEAAFIHSLYQTLVGRPLI